jgi:cytochrome c-type biogenesis protein CcmH
MKYFRRFAAGCLVAAGFFVSAQEPSPRERALQEKLVAACCWSESIAHHSSGKAGEMRLELRRMLEAGKSDEEILAAFQAAYGKRVLMEPAGHARAVAYAIPAVAGVLGLALVVWILRRWAAGRTGEDTTSAGS